MKRFRFVFPAVLAVTLLLSACSDDDSDNGDTPSFAEGVTEVERQILADTVPAEANGQLLELTRVVIPAGEGIPPHTHPGEQLAVIVAGTLTYTIIEGEASIRRAAGTDDEKVETYSAGDEIEINVGDAIHEPDGMIHQAQNDSDGPVIIYLSSLFAEGEPPALLVE